jgi:hypothetical protein
MQQPILSEQSVSVLQDVYENSLTGVAIRFK